MILGAVFKLMNSKKNVHNLRGSTVLLIPTGSNEGAGQTNNVTGLKMDVVTPINQ